MPIDVIITPRKTDGAEAASKFPQMTSGLHAAVVTQVKDLGERSFQGAAPKRTIVVTFTNTKGEEASRFYSNSLFAGDKARGLSPSTLVTDAKELDGVIPDPNQEYNLGKWEGRQVQVIVTLGTNKKGYPSAKVVQVLKPQPEQAISA